MNHVEYLGSPENLVSVPSSPGEPCNWGSKWRPRFVGTGAPSCLNLDRDACEGNIAVRLRQKVAEGSRKGSAAPDLTQVRGGRRYGGPKLTLLLLRATVSRVNDSVGVFPRTFFSDYNYINVVVGISGPCSRNTYGPFWDDGLVSFLHAISPNADPSTSAFAGKARVSHTIICIISVAVVIGSVSISFFFFFFLLVLFSELRPSNNYIHNLSKHRERKKKLKITITVFSSQLYYIFGVYWG